MNTLDTLETLSKLFTDNPYVPIFNIGDKINIRGYTDIYPGTIVKVKRKGREVEVRQDNYELDPNGPKPEMIPGGYSAHCTNNQYLKWLITDKPNGMTSTYTIRKWKNKYYWTAKGGNPNGRQQINHGWKAYHDYNF